METCVYQIVDGNMSIHAGLFTSKIMALEAIKSIMRSNENALSFYTIHRIPLKTIPDAYCPKKMFEVAVTWDDIRHSILGCHLRKQRCV